MHHLPKRIAQHFLILLCVISALALFSLSEKRSADGQSVEPRQSTTGPIPPPGTDTRGHVLSGLRLQSATVISGVPAYLWRHGCGPTAVGMVTGYYDSHGYVNLIPGDSSSQGAAVDTAIASEENYNDYCLPIDSYPDLLPDKSEPPGGDEHADNCIADFMNTSQSYFGNYYGWSWDSDIKPAFENFINLDSGYKGTSTAYHFSSFSWESLKYEIDNNRPLVFLVDSDSDGSTDHFITIIGYNSDGGVNYYGCYNTWDQDIHWFEYQAMGSAIPWGVYSVHTFAMTPLTKGDFLGTWDGQGVYFRNSEAGNWVKLASPADLVAAGDLDGEGKDDLVGIWPGQGGVWVRYSKTGAWAKLSTTAKHIAAGDMNGDGRIDLLGTWDGQGVYYRDSISTLWIKLASPATLITAGDVDGDNVGDLVGIWPTQGGVWVKYSKTGTWAKLSSSSRDIATGDMNGDGMTDLLGTWDGQGVFYRDSMTGAWVKMSVPGEQITAGDVDGDGTDDLIGLWASQGGIWVKYSKTGAWSKLSSPVKDMAAGLMRGAFWGSGQRGFIGLQGPVGGYAEGPLNLSKYKDLSSEGPGGWRFAAQGEKNIIPQATGRVLALPGPGEPGFVCTEQHNIIPQATAAKEKGDKQQGQKQKGERQGNNKRDR